MSAETLYAGPAKVYRGTTGFFPEGENGDVKMEVEQEKLAVASAMHGHLRYQQGDATLKITLKPFDNWGLLSALFPPALGASVGATAGVLADIQESKEKELMLAGKTKDLLSVRQAILDARQWMEQVVKPLLRK